MLRIDALNAHYGASHILQGVDLALAPGTIMSVLGRNGVGKTTTLAGRRTASPAPGSPTCPRAG